MTKTLDNGGDYEPHVQTPIVVEPEYPGEIGWKTDMHTYESKDTLFDCIKKLNKSKSKKKLCVLKQACFLAWKRSSTTYLVLQEIFCIPKAYSNPSRPPIKSISLAIHGEESTMFMVGNFHVWIPVIISTA